MSLSPLLDVSEKSEDLKSLVRSCRKLFDFVCIGPARRQLGLSEVMQIYFMPILSGIADMITLIEIAY